MQLTEKAEGQGRGPLRRHEATAHHRAVADQPARGAAARRADHRPRPAGPARRLGPAVPAQAAGRDLVLTTHYMDEAEQLCDRLVVMDKGLIVAEGSPLELIRAHSTREVAELRFGVGEHEAHRRQGRGPRRAGRGAARPAAALHRRRRGDARQGARARARPGRSRSYAAPRWRTSSSGSPAGRWSTDEPTTRAADARRPASAARRRRPAGRLLGHRLPAHLEGQRDLVLRDAAALRRSRWACCSAASSRATPPSSRARPRYLAFVAPGHARRPGDDDRLRRGHLPRDGR